MSLKSKSEQSQAPRWFVIEIAIVASLVLVFLGIYVGKFSAPFQSILSHGWVVVNLWLFLLAVRILLFRWTSRFNVLSIVLSLLVLSAWIVLLAYYVLVLIGLDAWGRVVTVHLIATYAKQWHELLDALGVTPFQLWLPLGFLFSSIVIAVWKWPKKVGWIPWLCTSLSSSAVHLTAVGLLGIVLVNFYKFVSTPPVASQEPISLTFFPEYAFDATRVYFGGAAALLADHEQKARNAYVPDRQAKKKTVILVVSDALRPDHMHVYGYARPTTPYLSELQASGRLVKVNGVRSVCAESACGLLAIARSKFPHQMTDNAITLPEILSKHGYRTHLILGGDHTNFYSLKAAYGAVDTYFDGSNATGYYMNDDQFLIDRVSSLPAADGKAEFFQFHFMSTHGLGKRHEVYSLFQPARNYYRKGVAELSVTADRLDDAAINYYDNGVLQFDQILKLTLQGLEKKGYLEDALVLITADHGEMLGEHGYVSHAKTVHEPVLSVPLLAISFGRAEPLHIDTHKLVSQVDIAPTILTSLGMPVPSSWSGFPLQKSIGREYLLFQQNSYSGLYDISEQDRVLKFVKDTTSGREYAHDLSRGQDEKDNVLGSIPADRKNRWRKQIAQQIAAMTELR